MTKTISLTLTHKKEEKQKNGDKERKALHTLMNNAVYGKTLEHIRKRINLRLVINEKVYLKWT